MVARLPAVCMARTLATLRFCPAFAGSLFGLAKAELLRRSTAMDPEYLSALTLMLIPGTPIQRLTERGQFALPGVEALLRELRVLVAETNPSDAIFRSNHASNYLPIGGRLPRDREAILQQIDTALAGNTPCRAEWMRGL